MDDLDADAQMQMERSSQAGSLDQMELEASHPSHHDADPAALTASSADAAAAAIALNKGIGATASDSALATDVAQDLDMDEYDEGDDDVKFEDIQDSLKNDFEMNAEVEEQTHLTEERDWKDVDADVDVNIVPAFEDGHDATATEEIATTDLSSAGLLSDHLVGDKISSGPALEKPSTSIQSASLEDGQVTLEENISEYKKSEVASASLGQSDAPEPDPPAEEDTHQDEEAYADAPDTDFSEPLASTAAPAHEPPPTTLARPLELRRPHLQKDYLSHVHVVHGFDASGSSSGDQSLSAPGSKNSFAPHVSLVHNGQEYSLFRPSSEPSGDEELVLFGHREQSSSSAAEEESAGSSNSTNQNSDFYYSTLETFIAALHSVFPHLKGDGENELILDFGILDLQISEDNIYCQQLSLYDFDRIRVGMCQPELDRLQLTLKTGKRFAFRFNELAEHCYRMFAGSEDDSGTIFDETVDDPLTTDYYAEEGVHEEAAEDAVDPEPSAGLDDAGADYVTGENVEDLENVEHAQNEAEEAEAEAGLPEKPFAAVATASSTSTILPHNENEGASVSSPSSSTTSGSRNIVSASAQDEQGDVHPPSDEYYEDPEFSQEHDHVEDEAVEPYEEDEEDVTVQGLDETAIEGDQQGSEGEQALDPEASLEEAALQAEQLEEAAFGDAEASVYEGEAHTGGDLQAGSDRKVDPQGNEEAANYYRPLVSPTNEEVVLLEQPHLSALDAPAEISKATVVDGEKGEQHVEASTEADTRVMGSKRGRELEDDDGYDSIYDNDYSLHDKGQSADSRGNESELDAKRPKIAVS